MSGYSTEAKDLLKLVREFGEKSSPQFEKDFIHERFLRERKVKTELDAKKWWEAADIQSRMEFLIDRLELSEPAAEDLAIESWRDLPDWVQDTIQDMLGEWLHETGQGAARTFPTMPGRVYPIQKRTYPPPVVKRRYEEEEDFGEFFEDFVRLTKDWKRDTTTLAPWKERFPKRDVS